ncbi:Dolichyl-diphosphooligosaccharide--protein glycosyltransferase subunit STT3A [Echinococcus granulosus]|uniref:Dolichyl-diphosphooligosaccharide--protein glycosyltransferase subunit STT3A n=2 Tax=Echinococcus granulosus TaxID=6210 RepID=W6VBZ1_ECHGR|nr:Dolichyl-diphosphooligosaccharide--protein glycosyltransferase subunit STT3A [Echinococcus granulosus]EUB64369.1 Dolichyl-diphosphooligosaccharide--protein glycosyltransferase subunit STT3A [Echinococcus granulosus]KAH9283452.1 Dolichyl-diphosphooligosaccharide--protein glycosyltransferase subunit STT3A [Echinococcus granulosus]
MLSHKKQQTLVLILVLCLSGTMAILTRFFSVLRFESMIHEFDPYFNYRTTKFMTEEGFYSFHNWFDDMAWYPLGRIIGGTIYPGLMMTATLFYRLFHLVHLTIDIRNVCVFLAPAFSCFTVFVTFLLTKEAVDLPSALVASAMISIVPGYTSRSVAGSYDNEGIAIFCMLLTFYFWVKSVNTGSIISSVLTGIAYFYMVSSWGGYVFLLNTIPLHVLTLMISGRFSHRIYVAYSVFYCIGTLLSMQISFVGFLPILSSEHMGALGVFGLCQIVAFANYLRTRTTEDRFYQILRLGASTLGLIFCIAVGVLYFSGKIAPWTGRFYSLLDLSYAKNHLPIIASVSEHQPTTWSSYFFDLHFMTIFFPVGLYYCFKKMTDASIFAIIYGILSLYFSGVMVRLMLVLAPIMCILSGVAVSNILRTFLPNMIAGSSPRDSFTAGANLSSALSQKRLSSLGKQTKNSITGNYLDLTYPFKSQVASIVVAAVVIVLALYSQHCIWVTSNAYSSPSIVMAAQRSNGETVLFDDYREAYYWLRQNTPPDAKIMSWWDYGYQITAIANRTVLVDNNTWNNTHIGRVGQAMASSEEDAYEILRELDVDYVLVIFGGASSYSSDDINKFLWMVRIAGSTEKGRHVKEMDYFSKAGEYRVDKEGSSTFLNCLLYKMSYYRFWEKYTSPNHPPGYDRVRNAVIGNKDFELETLEEAFTTENWIVRIFRVKKFLNRGHV